ncbi:hypothetical protein COY28_02215, partial [Candidatus Woesearchaeota archaeon CG_4_10_14_0_2_um_filter_57_5]
MEFDISRKPNPNVQHYADNDMTAVYDFSSKAYKEFGNFIKCIVLFGGAAKRSNHHDIDVLLVVDDLYMQVTPELVEAY